jgi:putative FmdB family regulatory protein
MPTYDYSCTECKASHTETCSIADKPDKVTCTICKSPMKQVYYSPAVTFSGAGFYSTDKKKK